MGGRRAAPEKRRGIRAPGKKGCVAGLARRGTGGPATHPAVARGEAGGRPGGGGRSVICFQHGGAESKGRQRGINARSAPPGRSGARPPAHPGPETPAGRGAGTGPSTCPAPQPGASSAGSAGRSGTPSAVGVAPAGEPVDRRPPRSQGRERAGLDPPSCAGRAEVCSRKHCGLDHSDLSMPMRGERSVPPRPGDGRPTGSLPCGEHGKNRDTVRR